jgi:hypothetical protein
MNPLAHLIAAAAIAVPMPFHAVAADRRFPDWPCVQVRVPEVSIAAVWTGQPLDDVRDTWRNEPRISDLVARLAARRTPLEEAKQGTVDFIRGGDGDRQERARVLFAGLFETLNQERLDVINGLERLTRKQREFASKIESDAARLRELQARPDSDQKEIAELTNQVNWGTRIFEERRKSVRFACEVPVIIEQRLFALGRAAQQALD